MLNVYSVFHIFHDKTEYFSRTRTATSRHIFVNYFPLNVVYNPRVCNYIYIYKKKKLFRKSPQSETSLRARDRFKLASDYVRIRNRFKAIRFIGC